MGLVGRIFKGRKDILKRPKGLTLQFLGQLLLVIFIGCSGAFKAELPGSDLIQPFHHLVFKMLDLSSRARICAANLSAVIFVPSTAQVRVSTSIHAVSRAALSLANSAFKSANAYAAMSWSPGIMPRAMSCSLYAAKNSEMFSSKYTRT
jgi:hypothetical protein